LLRLGILWRIAMTTIKATDDEIREDYERSIANKSKTWKQSVSRALDQYFEYLDERGLELQDTAGWVIEDWVNHELKVDGYADSTIENKVAAVRELSKYVAKRPYGVDIDVDEDSKTGIYGADLDLNTDSIKSQVEEEEIHFITPKEVKQIIHACDSIRDELLLEILRQTGVRATECGNIRLKDIDRDEQKIKIRTLKQESVETRYVYYKSSLEPLLYKWIDKRRRVAYTQASIKPDEGYLLVSKESPKMSGHLINRTVRNRAEDAGVQEVSFTDKAGREHVKVTAHTIRHSFAMARLNRDSGGMPIKFLKELMGHDHIETTEEYLQASESNIRDAYYRYSV